MPVGQGPAIDERVAPLERVALGLVHGGTIAELQVLRTIVPESHPHLATVPVHPDGNHLAIFVHLENGAAIAVFNPQGLGSFRKKDEVISEKDAAAGLDVLRPQNPSLSPLKLAEAI